MAHSGRIAQMEKGSDFTAALENLQDRATFHATGRDVGAARKQAEIDATWEAGKREAKGKRR